MEMDLVKGFLFVTIISLVYLQSDNKYVSKCPLTEEKWNEISKNYICNIGKRESYHCLRTTIGGFLEGCFEKSGIPFSEGCPVFHMEKGRPTLRYIKCNDSKGCPDTARGGVFLSDKVYMYPSCIKQVYMSETSSTGYGSTGQMVTELKRFSIVMKIDTTQGLSSWKTALIFVGTAVVFAIIVGLICLVLLQCQRIKRYKYEMERSTYMSSVPYNTDVTHIYHQDTDVYDYVDDTDMIDDDKNTPESNKLRQERYIDDESSSEAYVEPNRPSIESMERNEIFDINTQMKNAPLSCNMISQDTYLEPKVGLLTDRIRRDNVDVIESDGRMQSLNQRVCVKLTRLVSNVSYVEPRIGFHRSSQEVVECNVKEEYSSVISNKNITENEIAQNSESEESNMQDLNSYVHYDDASSRINTSFKEPCNPSETVSDLNISDKAENRQTEFILNTPVRRNENVVISQEPVETRSSQLEPIRNDDYIDPI